MRATNTLLNDEEHELLKSQADKENVSKGEIIRRAIRQYCSPLPESGKTETPESDKESTEDTQRNNTAPSLPNEYIYNPTSDKYEKKEIPSSQPEQPSEIDPATEIATKGWTEEIMKKIFGKIF